MQNERGKYSILYWNTAISFKQPVITAFHQENLHLITNFCTSKASSRFLYYYSVKRLINAKPTLNFSWKLEPKLSQLINSIMIFCKMINPVFFLLRTKNYVWWGWNRSLGMKILMLTSSLINTLLLLILSFFTGYHNIWYSVTILICNIPNCSKVLIICKTRNVHFRFDFFLTWFL
jgi:hypothetical protein